MVDDRVLKIGRWYEFPASEMEAVLPIIVRHEPVVYALYGPRGLWYIGITVNARRRLATHYRRYQFSRFKIRVVLDQSSQRWIERRLIYRLRPPGNISVASDLYAEPRYRVIRYRRWLESTGGA